jgi:hypothetical protein
MPSDPLSVVNQRDSAMASETYQIIRNGNGWAVNHDGDLEGDYATKEAAFESAASAASNAIKDGVGVVISVEPRVPGESSLGSKP